MNYLLFLTILPSYLLGRYVYRMDKTEKEPVGLLFRLFVGGMVAVALTISISRLAKGHFAILTNEATDIKSLIIYNFLGVALIEEACKWIMLFIFTWRNKNFNFLFDGIVYGVFVAIGFATVENFLYVFSNDGGFVTALLRAVLSVPAHAFFGVFMGYYYGLSKMDHNRKRGFLLFLILSLLIPILLHGTFDFCLSINSWMFMAAYALFVIILYIVSFGRIKHLSKNDRYIK